MVAGLAHYLIVRGPCRMAPGDMTERQPDCMCKRTLPDEIYNLAAQSHVQVSFETAEHTANADALGTLRLLEAIRLLGFTKKDLLYRASTSEFYGRSAAAARIAHKRTQIAAAAKLARMPSCFRRELVTYFEEPAHRRRRTLAARLLDWAFADRPPIHKSKICCDSCNSSLLKKAGPVGFVRVVVAAR